MDFHGNKKCENFHHLPCLISKIRGLRNIHVWFWLEVHKDWIESNRKKLKILTDLTPLHRKLQLHQVTTFNQKELDFTSKSTTCGWNMMKPKKMRVTAAKDWEIGVSASRCPFPRDDTWQKNYTKEHPCVMNHEPQKNTINSWVKKKTQFASMVTMVRPHFCWYLPPVLASARWQLSGRPHVDGRGGSVSWLSLPDVF